MNWVVMAMDIWQVLSQAGRTGSRSTALAPIHLGMVAGLGAFAYAAIHHVDLWVQIFLGAFLVALTGLFVRSYLYFMKKNPDALRSERFSLRKLEIQAHLGDSDVGNIPEFVSLPKLPASKRQLPSGRGGSNE